MIFVESPDILSPMRVRALAAVAVVVVLDQVSKALALSFLEPGRSVAIIDGLLHLTLTSNTGGAFGLFQGFGDVITLLAAGVSTVILGVLIWGGPRRSVLTAGMVAIAGGAIGNLIDRVMPGRGAVIDFLEFRVQEFQWPVFNLADTAIVIGTGLVLIALLAHERAVAQG